MLTYLKYMEQQKQQIWNLFDRLYDYYSRKNDSGKYKRFYGRITGAYTITKNRIDLFKEKIDVSKEQKNLLKENYDLFKTVQAQYLSHRFAFGMNAFLHELYTYCECKYRKESSDKKLQKIEEKIIQILNEYQGKTAETFEKRDFYQNTFTNIQDHYVLDMIFSNRENIKNNLKTYLGNQSNTDEHKLYKKIYLNNYAYPKDIINESSKILLDSIKLYNSSPEIRTAFPNIKQEFDNANAVFNATITSGINKQNLINIANRLDEIKDQLTEIQRQNSASNAPAQLNYTNYGQQNQAAALPSKK